MLNEQAILNQRYANAVDEGNHANRPSTKYKPVLGRTISRKWCATYGDDPQDINVAGVTGVGDSPEEAYADFDKAWRASTRN